MYYIYSLLLEGDYYYHNKYPPLLFTLKLSNSTDGRSSRWFVKLQLSILEAGDPSVDTHTCIYMVL
jgi:hypothetical protein